VSDPDPIVLPLPVPILEKPTPLGHVRTRVGLDTETREVALVFNVPIHTLTLKPAQARQLAAALLQVADACER
jgi:hypothetical protein